MRGNATSVTKRSARWNVKKVIGERMGRKGKEKVKTLARNDPPGIRCSEKAK